MITLRKARERGRSQYGWLDSRHSFSFAGYHDPAHMGVSRLRVINDDRVAPGAGFGAHPHRDMEIISYVLEGALEHKDSLGNGSVIRPGDVQRMSAGRGVVHSEFNASQSEPVHFLQIWIEPDRRGIEPGYEQKRFADADKRGRFRLLASPDGRDGSVRIHQDARLYATVLAAGEAAELEAAPGRQIYLHVARGTVEKDGVGLAAGDGATIREETRIRLIAREPAEVLLFDLP
ncbi:MAG: pirin family protein [Pseudomonadota bacterium]